MLYAVLIAVCSAGTPIAECDRTTAIHWIVAPAPQLISTCGRHGQQYAAQSRLAGEGAYVKIFCRPASRPIEAGSG
jgi:hypothetical protein